MVKERCNGLDSQNLETIVLASQRNWSLAQDQACSAEMLSHSTVSKESLQVQVELSNARSRAHG